jgi:hypothetical protein
MQQPQIKFVKFERAADQWVVNAVLRQSGGERLRGLPPNPNAWVGFPDIKFEVFIEITHPCARGIDTPSQKFDYRTYFFEGGGVFFYPGKIRLC